MTRSTLYLLFLCISAAGCQEVVLSALHGPPPGARAELDDDAKTIVLTRGAALAIDCTYGYDEPCEDIEAVSGDESRAPTFRLFRDSLVDRYQEGPQPQSGFVIVGASEGTTRLEVMTDQGDVQFDVEVLSPSQQR